MIEEILAGFGYFIFVFFKAFQQRNVSFEHYKWIMPIAYCMAITEILVYSIVAIKAVSVTSAFEMIPMVFTVGTGGGLGALIATWVHHRYVKK